MPIVKVNNTIVMRRLRDVNKYLTEYQLCLTMYSRKYYLYRMDIPFDFALEHHLFLCDTDDLMKISHKLFHIYQSLLKGTYHE